jgi:hypothetical protein
VSFYRRPPDPGERLARRDQKTVGGVSWPREDAISAGQRQVSRHKWEGPEVIPDADPLSTCRYCGGSLRRHGVFSSSGIRLPERREYRQRMPAQQDGDRYYFRNKAGSWSWWSTRVITISSTFSRFFRSSCARAWRFEPARSCSKLEMIKDTETHSRSSNCRPPCYVTGATADI